MGVVNDFFKYDYYDRGMMKWAGFYLSDHTTELKKEQTLSHNKDQQTIGKQQAEDKIGGLEFLVLESISIPKVLGPNLKSH